MIKSKLEVKKYYLKNPKALKGVRVGGSVMLQDDRGTIKKMTLAKINQPGEMPVWQQKSQKQTNDIDISEAVARILTEHPGVYISTEELDNQDDVYKEEELISITLTPKSIRLTNELTNKHIILNAKHLPLGADDPAYQMACELIEISLDALIAMVNKYKGK